MTVFDSGVREDLSKEEIFEIRQPHENLGEECFRQRKQQRQRTWIKKQPGMLNKQG